MIISYCFLIADQRSIAIILNNWDLLQQIADFLERDNGADLQSLARQFDIGEPALLRPVEPSRNFFNHLAHNRDVTLIDLKRLIEKGLRLNCSSIFPPIERAIQEGTVEFKLETTLAELRRSGPNWSYFLINVADKLLENTSQLPTWRDIADHYKYDYNVIESFCANLQDVRPTVRLFRHLVSMENVPTISILKNHLKTLNRHDIISQIDESLHEYL